MRIAVPRESAPRERRVALVPESCKKLGQAGYDLAIESGAGVAAGFSDAAYQEVGATVVTDPAALLGSADLVLKVTAPALADSGRDEPGWMRPGTIYVGSLMPLRNLAAVRALAAARVTAFSTDAIPRTTRAQSMDTLSSMANIAGYKGVLLAAGQLGKYFPMLMTAAGMVPPAKVFVVGAARGGAAGDRDRAPARRSRGGDRRPARGEGADRERRREVRRHRAGGERRGRRRLRQGAVGGRTASASASCWRSSARCRTSWSPPR